MNHEQLEELRESLDRVNLAILEQINMRAEIVQQIGEIKRAQGMTRYDPIRERVMLDLIATHNRGPFPTTTMQHLFKQIFKASLDLQEDDHSKALLVSRKRQPEDTMVEIKGEKIGDGEQRFVFGPCAVESYEQVFEVAKAMRARGERLLRGGAFKPRTSPYDFQGLGVDGLKILKRVADELDMAVISEIVTPAHMEIACEYVDMIQIGARNMQNFALLKEAGAMKKPVLLKRGLAATIEEFIHAAEYIVTQGNEQLVLCERGIRTYEKATRNTLDISAVSILKQETHLPVMVDVTHSGGRRDLVLPLAKAALAIGADAVMVEVHPDPAVALSDAAQQLDIAQFHQFLDALIASGLYRERDTNADACDRYV
ncbi:bifunctional 3-deoxy-7-phosphoheptulonate synthase/chorismate mutase [Shouchella lonarensis]|uniref:3-deoxy-D-arabinoheptulosonate-7-phosphate synthase /chorismate mutase n=1 Tax=Shouchella lonarensis TaxID=1464122 RepID=A0A1G6GHJ4_9BACI|nr:bifunctional 3-deoxy-7-phosphoheptulonate synthase/chorismate mutase [Shouchella lonarensis]SDB81225.1 3-deoxy-D-arabinoheptulosonate-7-phosphate synthase /chorismate mutase [Shouchella lonarensis]